MDIVHDSYSYWLKAEGSSYIVVTTPKPKWAPAFCKKLSFLLITRHELYSWSWPEFYYKMAQVFSLPPQESSKEHNQSSPFHFFDDTSICSFCREERVPAPEVGCCTRTTTVALLIRSQTARLIESPLSKVGYRSVSRACAILRKNCGQWTLGQSAGSPSVQTLTTEKRRLQLAQPTFLHLFHSRNRRKTNPQISRGRQSLNFHAVRSTEISHDCERDEPDEIFTVNSTRNGSTKIHDLGNSQCHWIKSKKGTLPKSQSARELCYILQKVGSWRQWEYPLPVHCVSEFRPDGSPLTSWWIHSLTYFISVEL